MSGRWKGRERKGRGKKRGEGMEGKVDGREGKGREGVKRGRKVTEG